MKNRVVMIILLAGIVLTSGTAFGITIIPNDLAVDFRDSAWALDNDSTASKTVNGVTAVADSIGNNAQYYNCYLFQDSNDGLGVQTYTNAGNARFEQDEINANEILTIYFTESTALSGVWLSDLYDWDEEFSNENFGQDEFGYLVINDTITITFGAFDNGQYVQITNGELLVSFGGLINVEKVVFYSGSETRTSNEYSVVGFVDSIPEPATMFLFGTGLLAMAGICRKRIVRGGHDE